MRVDDFDFNLPESLIAEFPAGKRDGSRLLVLHRDSTLEHRIFSEIAGYFMEGDILVLNNSKVLPVRIYGRKPTGGRIELLLIRKFSGDTYEILSRSRYTGRLYFEEGLYADIDNGVQARFNRDGLLEYVLRFGSMPLPPYIRRTPDKRDMHWYQTVYAEKDGSIAAPTAGLHFTVKLLNEIARRGVRIEMVTLHVGPGTFRPVKSELLRDHRMDPEEFEVDASIKTLLVETRRRGRRVFAVGTTTVRVIESLMNGRFSLLKDDASIPQNSSPRTPHSRLIRGRTSLFIYPGYSFKWIDSMITNFHLPRSTPLMLVAALAGRERIMNAYKEAMASGYRFFSYGDAMLIL